ncbi:hypothetical protein [Mesonia maritima]|uniref:Cation transport ATPase n=1 Tax=Mesonia maritima TaxID=1793873 RepID=A0ABU1K2J8_9FLAO|nr:hypothetical protein [Mesonia maritima]MDR6299835.1 cation transport ATPase [Mesonia maritima]
MKKLSSENIQFIRNYLKNSDVEYDDVLAEMTDHIASEIEMRLESENELFYDVFKNYMVQHKKALLENISEFRKKAFKRVVILLLKNLLSPIVLLSSFMLGLIFKFFPFSLAENLMTILLVIMSIEVLLFFMFQWKAQSRKRTKYSCLVNLALIIGWFNQCYLVFFHKVSLENAAFILLMIFVVLNASFLVTSIQLAKYYRKNYQVS